MLTRQSTKQTRSLELSSVLLELQTLTFSLYYTKMTFLLFNCEPFLLAFKIMGSGLTEDDPAIKQKQNKKYIPRSKKPLQDC